MDNKLCVLNEKELAGIDGGFVVSLGFTIAVCVEVAVGASAGTFLYFENKKLDERMKSYK